MIKDLSGSYGASNESVNSVNSGHGFTGSFDAS